MQFVIPQFIDVEDTIIGPITLKQFMLLLGVALFLGLLWYVFKLWLVIVIGVPIVALAAALVLVKVNGRPFSGFLKAWLNYQINPRFYIWKKK